MIKKRKLIIILFILLLIIILFFPKKFPDNKNCSCFGVDYDLLFCRSNMGMESCLGFGAGGGIFSKCFGVVYSCKEDNSGLLWGKDSDINTKYGNFWERFKK